MEVTAVRELPLLLVQWPRLSSSHSRRSFLWEEAPGLPWSALPDQNQGGDKAVLLPEAPDEGPFGGLQVLLGLWPHHSALCRCGHRASSHDESPSAFS